MAESNVKAKLAHHKNSIFYIMCFQNNAYWWFSLVCTTGDYYMARYNVGEHVSRSDNAANYSIDWFVRYVVGRNYS